MKFLMRIGVSFYVLTISMLSAVLLLFVSHTIRSQDVFLFLSLIYEDLEMRMIFGSTSLLFIFLSFIFARIISGGRQKERTIAFDNPSGRVTVSLGAMEDLVQRLTHKVPEIQDVKSNIIANKKGLVVDTRLVLCADTNIPEVTGRLQTLIKNKIQDTVGLDETVVIKVHIAKIISDKIKIKRTKNPAEEKEEKSPESFPFPGYRP